MRAWRPLLHYLRGWWPRLIDIHEICSLRVCVCVLSSRTHTLTIRLHKVAVKSLQPNVGVTARKHPSKWILQTPIFPLIAALEQRLGRDAQRNSLLSYPHRTPASTGDKEECQDLVTPYARTDTYDSTFERGQRAQTRREIEQQNLSHWM